MEGIYLFSAKNAPLFFSLLNLLQDNPYGKVSAIGFANLREVQSKFLNHLDDMSN